MGKKQFIDVVVGKRYMMVTSKPGCIVFKVIKEGCFEICDRIYELDCYTELAGSHEIIELTLTADRVDCDASIDNTNTKQLPSKESSTT
ncbi:MAG: hypothetical protein ABFS32_21315 [Bacteroidota bacterium]